MSKRDRDILRRVDERFAKEFLDDIKIQRIKLGIDKKMISDARLTKGMLKQSETCYLKEKLIRLPKEEDIR